MALAQRANAALWPSLVEAYHRRELTSTLMPNLVSTDFIHRAQADYVITLNREILAPSDQAKRLKTRPKVKSSKSRA
jgi:hypothetical protein